MFSWAKPNKNGLGRRYKIVVGWIVKKKEDTGFKYYRLSPYREIKKNRNIEWVVSVGRVITMI